MSIKKSKDTTALRQAAHQAGDILNRALIAVSLLVLMGVLFVGWQTLNGQSTTAIEPASLVSQSSAKPDSGVTLKLNHAYQRQGSEIKTDPSQVGRAGNPLSVPPK